MGTLTFDMSTHERAHYCLRVLQAEGFSATALGLVPEARPGVEVTVDAAAVRWASSLVRAVDPRAILRP